jgi:hypothetical protein
VRIRKYVVANKWRDYKKRVIMDETYNQRRIVSVHQMLFEMARGNFNSKIPESKEKDELETIVVLINMVAEEIKGSLFEFVNVHSTTEFITQTNLILDSN